MPRGPSRRRAGRRTRRGMPPDLPRPLGPSPVVHIYLSIWAGLTLHHQRRSAHPPTASLHRSLDGCAVCVSGSISAPRSFNCRRRVRRGLVTRQQAEHHRHVVGAAPAREDEVDKPLRRRLQLATGSWRARLARAAHWGGVPEWDAVQRVDDRLDLREYVAACSGTWSVREDGMGGGERSSTASRGRAGRTRWVATRRVAHCPTHCPPSHRPTDRIATTPPYHDDAPPLRR